MKKLSLYILISLLWCSVGFSKIGDVYYCEMNKIAKTNANEVIEFENQKFKFKREKNILKFGSEGFFSDYETAVLKNIGEYFWGGGDYSRFIYTNGKFVFSSLLNVNEEDKDPEYFTYSIVANCDIL